MRSNRQLQLQQLDVKLDVFKPSVTIAAPSRGWLHAIRTSLNMTMSQLAVRLGLTTGAIQKIEEREANGSISLNKLRAVGEAMSLKLVYGFVPMDGSLENLIERRALEVARNIVMRTHNTMVLENQAIYGNKVDDAITDLAAEIKRELRKSLWD